MSNAFYRAEGDAFVPTELTRGPWSSDAQHAGPPSALVGRALERLSPQDGLRLARVTIEILSPVPMTPLRIEATVARPGRSVELLEASVRADGAEREVLRARAWRLRPQHLDTEIGDGRAPPAAPGRGREASFFPGTGEVGYHTAMEVRFLEGAFTELGPASAWLRMRQPLVDGEEPTPLQRLLVAADTGNGLSASLDFRSHVFINTDLTVYLVREPEGEWVHMDARTYVSADGVGMSDTVLSDGHGRLGRALQALFVAPRDVPVAGVGEAGAHRTGHEARKP